MIFFYQNGFCKMFVLFAEAFGVLPVHCDRRSSLGVDAIRQL
jgi:hypothetical protein